MWIIAVLLVTFVLPAVSWAGLSSPRSSPVSAAPAMDEIGLAVLAIAMVGTGVILLRRRGSGSAGS